MGTRTGVSTLGWQELESGSFYTGRIWSLKVSKTPLLPPVRVGYVYVFTFDNAAPTSLFLIDRLPIYQPGVFQSISVAPPGTTWLLKLYAQWDKNNLAWSTSVA